MRCPPRWIVLSRTRRYFSTTTTTTTNTHVLVVGLGNPETTYKHTRHNIGKECVQEWVSKSSSWGTSMSWEKHHDVYEATLALPQNRTASFVVLSKSFMNLSGGPIRNLVKQRKLNPATDLLVVHDELEMDVGKVRIKTGGSARGHNGVRNIIACIGTPDFARLCIGIGRRTSLAVSQYVLEKFDDTQRELLDSQSKPAALDAIMSWMLDETSVRKTNTK